MSLAVDPFDRAFDSILEEKRADLPLSASPPRPLPADVERQLEQALQQFADGNYLRAQEELRGALRFSDSDPRIGALAAACNSLLSGRLRPGLETCLQLLEHRSHLPDLYAILGVLLLKSRQRAEAHAVFRDGLLMAPVHRPLQIGIESMGIRQPAVLRFLRRSHPINRWLGHLRTWLCSSSLHPSHSTTGGYFAGHHRGR